MADFPTLQFGSSGPIVALLQTALNMIESALAQLDTDGQFGGRTSQRVREFQGQMSLSQDGVAGGDTWSSLQYVLSTAGYALSVVGGIIAANIPPPPPPKSWRDSLSQPELALRDKLLTVAKAETDAQYGIKQNMSQIFQYMMESCVSPPGQTGSDKQKREQMCVRSWCSDFVYHCLSMAGARMPVKANVALEQEHYGSISRFKHVFQTTTAPKPGDLYIVPHAKREDMTKSFKTWHIGIFRYWGSGEDDPSGPSAKTFDSYDGNSISGVYGNLALMQTVPDGSSDPGSFRFGSYYNQANTRDAFILTSDSCFLNIWDASPPPTPTGQVANFAPRLLRRR